MGYMHFKEPALEKLFKNFKWTRNNTIELFEAANDAGLLQYTSNTHSDSTYTFQPLLYQFQCIISTTDTYTRKLTNADNQSFGIVVVDGIEIPKEEIAVSDIGHMLKSQLNQLGELLREFNAVRFEKYADKVATISNHEYLHHGQIIVAFREAGEELPERFKKAWAL